ncbi:MAG: hypothetical protein HY782_12575, partial [Chloroflexi bacterium]|nr:hypothetical protein [Chloroflexota bacterium]
MGRSVAGSYQWTFYLTTGLLLSAVALRSLLVYAGSVTLPQVLGQLLVSLILLIFSESSATARFPAYLPLYLLAQTSVALLLMLMPGAADFYAILFAILSMQVMRRSNPRTGAAAIALFAALMTLPLVKMYGMVNGIAFMLLYTFVNVLVAAYALASRRAQEARSRNEALAQELDQANRQLQTSAAQAAQLAAARERHRMARELHDSVTQTIFSMTLTTQSALLLLERDAGRVGPQLDRLNQLAQSALAEMRVLTEVTLVISELRPGRAAEGGLVAALRRHLASRQIPEELSVSLEIEGDAPLDPAEEQSLFRIAQEALNN